MVHYCTTPDGCTPGRGASGKEGPSGVVLPAGDGDKVADEAGDVTLEEDVVAADDVGRVDVDDVILGHNCGERARILSFFSPNLFPSLLLPPSPPPSQESGMRKPGINIADISSTNLFPP